MVSATGRIGTREESQDLADKMQVWSAVLEEHALNWKNIDPDKERSYGWRSTPFKSRQTH